MADNPTCRHGYDLDHLTATQAEAVVTNCEAGLIHTDDDAIATPAHMFTIDEEKFGAWLLGKVIDESDIYTDGEPVTPENVTLGFLADNLSRGFDDFTTELLEASAIVPADGWSIGIYAIDTEDSWAYLLTVRPGDAHHGRFVQVAGLSEDVSSDDTMRSLFDELVADANRLLPAARAALAAVNPPEETPRLVAVLNDDGELACPECGNTMFGYEENAVEYRYPGEQDPAARTVSVIWTAEAGADSGDSDPGLFCDAYRHNGCGKPIDLPPGWEISYG